MRAGARARSPGRLGPPGRRGVLALAALAAGACRATPLRAPWRNAPYFHDGSAEDLEDVVRHYDGCLDLGLSDRQVSNLAECLESL